MALNIFGKTKQDKMELEKDRYLQAQLHLLQSKLQRLERIFSVGMPLGEAEETIERLDKIEKGVKVVDSKVEMFANVLKGLKDEYAKLLQSLDTKAGINQLQIISQRIKFLENIYGELSSTKTKDIFLNIVDILKNLETRMGAIEDIAHKNMGLLFKKELEKVEKEADEQALPETEEQMQEKAAAMPGMEKRVAAGQGISGKISLFFKRILGRK
jgi:hypothetical protein